MDLCTFLGFGNGFRSGYGFFAGTFFANRLCAIQRFTSSGADDAGARNESGAACGESAHRCCFCCDCSRCGHGFHTE